MRTLAALCITTVLAFAQEPQAPAAKPAAPQQPAAGGMTWTGVLDEKEFAALHALKADKAPKLNGEMISIGDSKHYLSIPANQRPPFASVILVHEWYGLNDHIKHWADRLAADGYAALAVDLYDGKIATNSDDAMKYMKAASADVPKAVATMRAAFDFLATSKRVVAQKRAVLGWCFGGGMSLQMALAEPKLDACVIYYGRLVDDPKALAAIQGPVLGIFGNQDKGIPPASVDAFAAAMKTAGKDLRLHRYEANHAFANPSSAAYDQDNATKAWTEVRAFLAETLKGEKPKAAAPAAGSGDKK